MAAERRVVWASVRRAVRRDGALIRRGWRCLRTEGLRHVLSSTFTVSICLEAMDTVENQLNTLAKNSSPTDPDRGNQPRWERVTASFAGVTPGPDPLPSAMSWAFFTGHELDRYTVNFPHPHPYSSYPGIYVGSYPSSTLPANHLYYFRYRFKLDASVNLATYKLQLPAGAVRADDHVRGIYLNGKRMHASLPGGVIIFRNIN